MLILGEQLHQRPCQGQGVAWRETLASAQENLDLVPSSQPTNPINKGLISPNILLNILKIFKSITFF